MSAKHCREQTAKSRAESFRISDYNVYNMCMTSPIPNLVLSCMLMYSHSKGEHWHKSFLNLKHTRTRTHTHTHTHTNKTNTANQKQTNKQNKQTLKTDTKHPFELQYRDVSLPSGVVNNGKPLVKGRQLDSNRIISVMSRSTWILHCFARSLLWVLQASRVGSSHASTAAACVFNRRGAETWWGPNRQNVIRRM